MTRRRCRRPCRHRRSPRRKTRPRAVSEDRGWSVKKVIAAAALAWASAAVLLLGQSAPARLPAGAAAKAAPQAATPRLPAAAPAKAGLVNAEAEKATHRAWLKQYCVGCHNERTPLPAND